MMGYDSSMAKAAFLYRRQKQLLALLEVFDRRLTPVDFQKYLFLLNAEYYAEPAYEFVPYRFGCFSFQSYADRRKLTELGLLKDDSNWQLTSDQETYTDLLPRHEADQIQAFASCYQHLSGNELVRHVYKEYPYYATRSEIASKLLAEHELVGVEQERNHDDTPALFTIGYEGGSFENYLNRLIKNNVQLLCDVRKNPLSRKYGFSRRVLSDTVEKLGIRYVHLPELGIVSDKRRSLDTPQDYQALFNDYELTVLPQNTESLDRVAELVKTYGRVALTCFEAESCMCHRGRVAHALARRPSWKHDVIHI